MEFSDREQSTASKEFRTPIDLARDTREIGFGELFGIADTPQTTGNYQHVYSDGFSAGIAIPMANDLSGISIGGMAMYSETERMRHDSAFDPNELVKPGNISFFAEPFSGIRQQLIQDPTTEKKGNIFRRKQSSQPKMGETHLTYPDGTNTPLPRDMVALRCAAPIVAPNGRPGYIGMGIVVVPQELGNKIVETMKGEYGGRKAIEWLRAVFPGFSKFTTHEANRFLLTDYRTGVAVRDKQDIIPPIG
jgi:hypothetical protein